MHGKKLSLTNFAKSVQSTSQCYRPEKERDLKALSEELVHQDTPFLARGAGLSYNDCCINEGGNIIDTRRLNHLLSFDEDQEELTCQPAVTFKDLFLVHPHYIPPVIPGTLHATLAGGVANDVHGKNNHVSGTLGKHIVWIDLLQGSRVLRVSRDAHSELFYATIGGLGLTGVIKGICLKMSRASRYVRTKSEKYDSWESMLQGMPNKAKEHQYHAAWIDLNRNKSILFLANHLSFEDAKELNLSEKKEPFSVPSFPFRLIGGWNMALYNRWFFHTSTIREKIQSLAQFNNPLDGILNWNNLYGKRGLLQFQAVLPEKLFPGFLEEALALISKEQATPTLSVLKYFSQSGVGLLSFVEPGFSIAIDFIHNASAESVIQKMNALITETKGKVYLAKDLLLTASQFSKQYPNHQAFFEVLKQCPNSLQSSLSRRLGLEAGRL